MSLCCSSQDVLSWEVRMIVRSDEEKELVWRHPEDHRMPVVKNISETFIKNIF